MRDYTEPKYTSWWNVRFCNWWRLAAKTWTWGFAIQLQYKEKFQQWFCCHGLEVSQKVPTQELCCPRHHLATPENIAVNFPVAKWMPFVNYNFSCGWEKTWLRYFKESFEWCCLFFFFCNAVGNVAYYFQLHHLVFDKWWLISCVTWLKFSRRWNVNGYIYSTLQSSIVPKVRLRIGDRRKNMVYSVNLL